MAERLDYVTPGEPFKPSATTWNAFVDTARTVRQQRVIFGVPPLQASGDDNEQAQGRLTSALAPCDNALTGATTFTFARYVTDGSIDPQTDPVTMTEETSGDPPEAVETEGVNRSKLEAAVDGHVVCVKINGEWVPVLCFDICPE